MEGKVIEKNRITLSGAVAKHPFWCLVIACLYVMIVFDSAQESSVSTASLIFAVGSAVVAGILYAVFFAPLNNRRNCIITSSGFIVISLLFFVCAVYFPNTPFYLALFGIVVTLFATLLLIIRKKMTTSRAVMIIVVLGFIIRCAYILYTTYETRQHDVWYFDTVFQNGEWIFPKAGTDKGHAGYIEYLYTNLALPDFDPRSVWQFYHPPLHHIICALWLRLQNLLGINMNTAIENIQILTLFYSSACMIVTYKILRCISFRGVALGVSVSVIAFAPTFYLLAGSINNDTLSVFLCFMSVWMLLRWYQKPTLGRIIPIAVTVGLAMMAKLSAAMVAPAIAIVMLVVFIRSNKKLVLLRDFVIFGIIVFPLGLWWQVYNMIKYNMPISYVPMLSTADAQYVGNYSLVQRILGITPEQFDPIYIAWNSKRNGASYTEYNMLVALLKTSVFGEHSLFYISAQNLAAQNGITASIYKAGNLLANGLFISNILVVVMSVVGFFRMLFSKKSRINDIVLKCFFALIFIMFFVSYISFCIQYPHTCTMNIRYCVPLILISAISLGALLPDKLMSKKLSVGTKIYSVITLSSVSLFGIFSVATYTLLALI